MNAFKYFLTILLLLVCGVVDAGHNYRSQTPEQRNAAARAKCEEPLNFQRSWNRGEQQEREIEAATEAINKRYRTPQQEREHRQLQALTREVDAITEKNQRAFNASVLADYQRCMEKIK